MRVSTLMIKNTEKECIFGLMEEDTRDSGHMGNNMEKVIII